MRLERAITQRPRAIIPAMVAVLLISCVLADGINFNFETGDLQGWQVVEGAFDKLVCDRDVFHNAPTVRYNKEGRYFLSTLEQADGRPNDTMTGVIVSPVFTLTDPAMSFLIGGGRHSNTYVALCTVDGEEVLKASGDNTEIMRRVVWNNPQLVGRAVFLKIVDQNRGSWGHVTFDDFQATGKIDFEATARLRANFAEAEKKRLARFEAQRRQRMEKRMSDELLFSPREQRVYEGDYLSAISLPVGGIGTGSIEINGRAERHIWHIFNNFESVAVPDSFFAVRVQRGQEKPIVRVLQTTPLGSFQGFEKLTFRGEYPFGWFDFADAEVPVSITLETFNPLIPLNERDSGIPCAIYNMTVHNPTTETLSVAFLASQQNASGFTGDGPINGRYFPTYGANTNRVLVENRATMLHMTSHRPEQAPGYGDMVLGAMGENVTATAQWTEMEALAGDFTDDGRLNGPERAGPSSGGETIDGALSAAFALAPGERRTVTFFLTWHFPNAWHGHRRWGGYGNMYSNWWDNALAVARELVARLDELTDLTRLYHDTFYASNLPHWLLDRISSQVVVLRSPTCFWTKAGYFGGWEGCSKNGGCCAGNCSHVWHYAQAHARLFPAIARAMREQEFRHQKASGLVPFRQGWDMVAGDAQSAVVLNSYREHLCSPDRRWLDKHWPAVRKAMDFAIATWDSDEDGVLTGPQHNTLDGELGGNSSWLGSMYLAALAAAERMARLQGEPDTADRYKRIRESGSKTHNETLWNGEYYIQIPDATAQQDYGTGCHIDQVLGQWWANQLDLGWIYPRDRVRAALQALIKYNFRADFRGIEQLPRKFVDDDDAGMQMITWPKGGRPNPPHIMQYADEVMSGFEYSAAAAMIQVGLLREAFTVLRAAYDRYDGRLRTGLSDAAWGYSGNPFCDDECGKFYARPMSIWSVLLACQGFVYDGPEGLIGFRPIWQPENHRSFFTAARGWGLFTQTRQDGRQTERLEVRYGEIELSHLIFEVPNQTQPSKCTVTCAGKAVSATFSLDGRDLHISLARKVTVRQGEELAVTID
jgi:non-lysosomal glucosylceramidase